MSELNEKNKAAEPVVPEGANPTDAKEKNPASGGMVAPYRRAGGPDEGSSGGLDVWVGQGEAVRSDAALRRYYGYEKARRRSPKPRRFTRFIILFSVIALAVVAALAAVAWAAAGIASEASATAFMDDLVSTTDQDGWRRLVRMWLPASYPEYEDSSRLAGEVIAPAFRAGKVTWLRKTGEKDVCMLFSDGEYFADVTLGGGGSQGRQIEKIEFRVSYFNGRAGIVFPVRTVTAPKGAEITVNSVKYESGAEETDVVYPYLSPAEPGRPLNCVEYRFTDIYFEPEITATFDGTPLEAVWSDDRLNVCFRYPESSLRVMKITVPAGAECFAGEKRLSVDWAEREFVSGELGPLDDNGTGTLPQLAVWTVGGLFEYPEVRAEAGGDSIKLLSSDGGNFVFEIPASCKYTVRVTVPAGYEVTVNGVKTSQSDLAAEGGGPLSSGWTKIGALGGGAVPAVDDSGAPVFLTYVKTGYLAPPVVEATLDGVRVEPSGSELSGYRMNVEYDVTASSGQAEAEPLACASHFFLTYLKYVCDGGVSEGRQSEFDLNYDELLASMVEGTAGYTGIMESYREVYRLPNHPDAVFAEPVCTGVFGYNRNCAALVLETEVTPDPNSASKIPASMTVLVLKTEGGWQVYGFECSFDISGEAQDNPGAD